MLNYSYHSHSKADLRVLGDGFVSKLMRKLADTLINREETVDYNVNASKCAPKITQLSAHRIYVLLGQICALLFLILIEVYLKRFNRQICAFFYRKWEKMRVIWLYNDMLKKRAVFIRSAKKKILFKMRNGLINVESPIEEYIEHFLEIK